MWRSKAVDHYASDVTLFRKRMGFIPEGPPIVDEVPRRVRSALVHVLEDHAHLFGTGHWTYVYKELLRASRRPPVERSSGEGAVQELLAKADFKEVFEIIEHVSALAIEYDRTHIIYTRADVYRAWQSKVNRLLADENVGYQLDDKGLLQLTASHEMIDAAASALHATEHGHYAASAGQLRRALEKLTFRKLDPTNAAKDAVGALEGAVRTRCEGKGDIGDNVACLNKILHPTLVSALVKLEAYRGDMAAHADRPGRAVKLDEAIFVVHVCSAAIALLTAKPST